MNGSVFSKARYMNGVGFEILARTPVPKLPLSAEYEHLTNIEFDGISVSFVSDHRHLGLTLSNNGRWNKHIANIVNSASKSLAFCADP